jgi:hypothetical protein
MKVPVTLLTPLYHHRLPCESLTVVPVVRGRQVWHSSHVRDCALDKRPIESWGPPTDGREGEPADALWLRNRLARALRARCRRE